MFALANSRFRKKRDPNGILTCVTAVKGRSLTIEVSVDSYSIAIFLNTPDILLLSSRLRITAFTLICGDSSGYTSCACCFA